MPHVFIVNEETFKIHLQYMFAGTGAKNLNCDFLLNNTKIHHTLEKLLTGMIADISRIRIGDKVLFYLQASSHEGTFFGAFEVADIPFISNNNYLYDELHKNLTFRIKIKPFEIYQKGVSERECLDYLDNISHPYEMCWSLIYRKLKGNRGCTMITEFEYERIMSKIRKINKNIILKGSSYTYCKKLNQINIDNNNYIYSEDIQPINIKNKLISKMKQKKSFEVFLQAYLLQNLEKLSELTNNLKITWIGNEVSCGVGMQSIDLMYIQEDTNIIYINVCELKDEEIAENIAYQLKKYILWLKYYIIPTYKKKVIINPMIVAKNSNNIKEILHSIQLILDLELKNQGININPIAFISFELVNNDILLERI